MSGFSPYELVLGDDLELLHPRLRAYFGEIPPDHTGVGVGQFDRVGSRLVWLWPVLTVLGRQGVLFPTWGKRVPFTIENHPVVDYRGNAAILATRTFHFRSGDREMVDAITAERGRLVDHLGVERRYSARLSASVVDGELHLESTRVRVRFGRLSIPIPRRFAPVVTLVERFDENTELQHVEVTVDSPALGRLYEYSGSFRYEIIRREARE